MRGMMIAVSSTDPMRKRIDEALAERGMNSSCMRETASEVRESIARDGNAEVWIFSSDDMGAINLAAAIAKDHPDVSVYASGYVSDEEGRQIRRASGVAEIGTPDFLLSMFIDSLSKESREDRHVLEDDVSGEDAPSHSDGDTEKPETRNEPSVSIEGMSSRLDCASIETINSGKDEAQEGGMPPKNASAPKAEECAFSKKSAQTITVLSGSGGVGKSTVVATAAYLAASKGHFVGVIDCDLQFGDMGQLMGEAPSISIDDIFTDDRVLRDVLSKAGRDLPILISAPSRMERSEELSGNLDEVLEICESVFDVIFVNTGSSWSEVNAQLVEKSGCSIFAIDQRASSVRSCRHALDLCIRMGLATGQFVYALNKCRRGSLFCAADIAGAMEGGTVIELKDGGSEVEELLGMGLAFELAASKNDFTESLNGMLDEVLA